MSDIQKDKIGVFVDKDLGAIDVYEDMPKDRMWVVLKWAFSEIVSLRSREYVP